MTSIDRRQLFETAAKVWSLSSLRRKSSSSQNRKAGHTHTLTHTQDDCYTLATACGGKGNNASCIVMLIHLYNPLKRSYYWRHSYHEYFCQRHHLSQDLPLLQLGRSIRVTRQNGCVHMMKKHFPWQKHMLQYYIDHLQWPVNSTWNHYVYQQDH